MREGPQENVALHQKCVTGDAASWLSFGARASEAGDAESNRDRASELVCHFLEENNWWLYCIVVYRGDY